MDKGSPVKRGQVQNLRWCQWSSRLPVLKQLHRCVKLTISAVEKEILCLSLIFFFLHFQSVLCTLDCRYYCIHYMLMKPYVYVLFTSRRSAKKCVPVLLKCWIHSAVPASSLPWMRWVQPCWCKEPQTGNLKPNPALAAQSHANIHVFIATSVIHSHSPLDIQNWCFSDSLKKGLIRSSSVTAARALMLEDTVLGLNLK